jgi:predicted enzyme related to lactoylglutathione lyase
MAATESDTLFIYILDSLRVGENASRTTICKQSKDRGGIFSSKAAGATMANHGQFVWYDLITPDPEAAKEFYCHVIGWGTQAWKGPQPYTMWENEGIPIGGLVKTASGMGDTPQWLPYVGVDDINETLSKAKDLGARIMTGPKDVPGSGRYAIVEDPQGATIAVFASAAPTESADFNPSRGQPSWHELVTDDYEKAFEFYNALFDWNRTSDFDMGPMGRYQMYGKGEIPYGGMMNKPAGTKMPSSWCCYIMVDDVHAAVDKTKSLGGQVINGPMQPPGGSWVAQCIDPQGVLFALHSTGAA